MSELRTSYYFLFFYFEAYDPNKIYTGMIRQSQKSAPRISESRPYEGLENGGEGPI